MSIETVTLAGRHDNTYHIGTGAYSTSGTVAGAWNATLKRYCRRLTTANTGARAQIAQQFDPRSLLDPRYGQSAVRMRTSELVCVTYTGLPTGTPTVTARAVWGFSGAGNSAATNTAIYAPLVGFKMQYSSTLAGLTAGSTWNIVVIDDTLSVLYNVSTGISALALHELSMMIDGRTNTVYFYIDGVQVGSYSPATNTVGGQAATYGVAPTTAVAFTMMYESVSSSSSGGNLTMVYDFHMLPVCPIITFEFTDAES